jgi:hypothetical protein
MFAHQKKMKLLDQSAAGKEAGRFLPARDLSLFFVPTTRDRLQTFRMDSLGEIRICFSHTVTRVA